MNTADYIVSFILILMFTFSAATKFFRQKTMVQHWNDYRYPFWFMDVTAALELIGVIGILASFRYPGLLTYAAALIAALMLGAIHAHLVRAKHKLYMVVNAGLMLGLAAWLLFR
ncbi:DoxX family protein [Paenibacillus nanensis]|uniref:DoxX family protein n=1 Tax=Paenibacillus nanensis TaxID=393251 RepID=A0A3A1UUA1_9BACL|nr:DoxX family protein [Paenibacillus nanensis]RIX52067.1 DoxX family protein [Paenibacillus nanensis]